MPSSGKFWSYRSCLGDMTEQEPISEQQQQQKYDPKFYEKIAVRHRFSKKKNHFVHEVVINSRQYRTKYLAMMPDVFCRKITNLLNKKINFFFNIYQCNFIKAKCYSTQMGMKNRNIVQPRKKTKSSVIFVFRIRLFFLALEFLATNASV